MRKMYSNLKRLSRVALLASMIMPWGEMMAQEKPQLKVDFSFWRNKPSETGEPGFTEWHVPECESDSITIDGIVLVMSKPSDATDYVLRQGWNKSYVQLAEYKEQNGRLTFDGVTLDPNSAYGSMTLTIKGLPAGEHTIQTYHNNWGDPKKTYIAPFDVRCNGRLVHQGVKPSFLQAVAANACLLTTKFTIAKDGDPVRIEFSTSEANPSVQETPEQKNVFNAPFCNGFELNTVNVTSLAKEPYPASGDMHADADNKTITLKWSPANSDIKQHQLFIGSDSAVVADMTAPTATLAYADSTYILSDVYSMNTYYWRVDEVDASGSVTKGHVWHFKPRQLAFPNAEGYGRFANGGRGGIVYHVTSLSNTNEPGTLLYGLTADLGPRTIVFDVAGIIDFGFKAVFPQANITLAGQTAPGKGICIKGSNINFGSDHIVRHMRLKHGYGDTGNAMGLSGADHAIVDHTTAAWGTDETVSGRGAKNISFQYCMIAEALGIADHKNYGEGANHGFAATIDGKIGSYHHNLLVNCNGRNWSMGGGMDGQNKAIGQMDIFNNVVYNWNGRTTDGNCHEVNFVNNYYKMGPDTRRTQLFIQQYENIGHEESTWRAYISGNIRENKNGSLTYDKKGDTYDVQLSNGDPGPDYESVVDQPFFPSYAKIHTAKDAFKVVTSEAGATMPMRDDQHVRVVKETVTGTYTYVGSRSGIKGEIDHEDDAGGWEAYPEEARAADFDTDQDGMPNWYEKIVNSNPDVANNNEDPDKDGWTLLEDYLEFMAHPYLIVKAGEQATIDAAQFFKGFTKSPQYTISADGDWYDASVSGSSITVGGKQLGGIGIITMKVTDSDGSTHEKRLSVAVTGEITGINNVTADKGEVVKREFFTVDGKQTSTFVQHEVYIMKETCSDGKVYSTKVIRN